MDCVSIADSPLWMTEIKSLHQSIDKVKAETNPVCNILITIFSE